MDSPQLNIDDPAEVAGYVDAGVYELERWLWSEEIKRHRRQAGLRLLMLHMGMTDEA